MSDYIPFVGTLEDGTEVLVSVSMGHPSCVGDVRRVEVAFRSKPHHVWSPPTTCEKR